MQNPDVHRPLDRWLVARQQAVRGVRLRETQTVNHDARLAGRPLDGNGLGAAAEDLDRLGEDQLLGDARQRIVIAANDEDPDTCLVQAMKLIGEIACRLHRRLIAVIEIAREEERIDLLGEAQIDDAGEGLARRVSDQIGKLGIAQRERLNRRIQMNIGRMHEAKRHRYSYPVEVWIVSWRLTEINRLPSPSCRTVSPGSTTVVQSSCSRIAGPSSVASSGSFSRA